MTEEIQKAVEVAEGGTGYLVAVFSYDGKQLHLSRFTKNFPYSEFTTAVKLLKTNLDQEIIPTEQPPMKLVGQNQPQLPPAPKFPPGSKVNAKRTNSRVIPSAPPPAPEQK